MRHPFHRVHLYTLIILIIQCVTFYLFRRRLTTGIVSLIVPPFPADWQYHELIPASLWLFAGFNTWAYSKLHGWRSKSKPTKALVELETTMQTLSGNITTLNENVWSLFKYFNPVLEQNGLRFELDDVGKITLRDAAAQVERKQQLVKEKKRELEDAENIQVVS